MAEVKKFHKGDNGRPMPCVAQGRCPKGGSQGHGTFEQVQAYCDKYNHAVVEMALEELIDKAKEDTPENDIYRTALYERTMENFVPTKKTPDEVHYADFDEENTGISLNVRDGEVAEHGFFVSVYPERGTILEPDATEEEFRAAVEQFLKDNDDLLKKDKHVLGFWKSPTNHKTYIDVSVNVDDAGYARDLGDDKDQIAYFDSQTFEEITINANATSGQANRQEIKNAIADFMINEYGMDNDELDIKDGWNDIAYTETDDGRHAVQFSANVNTNEYKQTIIDRETGDEYVIEDVKMDSSEDMAVMFRTTDFDSLVAIDDKELEENAGLVRDDDGNIHKKEDNIKEDNKTSKKTNKPVDPRINQAITNFMIYEYEEAEEIKPGWNGIAYTSTENEKYDIQFSANVDTYEYKQTITDKETGKEYVLDEHKFETPEEMAHFFEMTDFEGLTYVDDDLLEEKAGLEKDDDGNFIPLE